MVSFIYKNFINGKLDGERKEWEYNGRLNTHEFYKNGKLKLDGERKEWHNNGQLYIYMNITKKPSLMESVKCGMIMVNFFIMNITGMESLKENVKYGIVMVSFIFVYFL